MLTSFQKSLFNYRAKNKQKLVPSDHKELIRGVVKFKEGLEASVEDYDHMTLPPVYHQVHCFIYRCN